MADLRAEEAVPAVEVDQVGIRGRLGSRVLEGVEDRPVEVEGEERNPYNLAGRMAGIRGEEVRRHFGLDMACSWHRLPWVVRRELGDKADNRRHQTRWEVNVAGHGRQSSLLGGHHHVLLPWSVRLAKAKATSV